MKKDKKDQKLKLKIGEINVQHQKVIFLEIMKDYMQKMN